MGDENYTLYLLLLIFMVGLIIFGIHLLDNWGDDNFVITSIIETFDLHKSSSFYE